MILNGMGRSLGVGGDQGEIVTTSWRMSVR